MGHSPCKYVKDVRLILKRKIHTGMSHQSLCDEYLNLSSFPSISDVSYECNLNEIFVDPVNKGLVPIHYKYLVRNLTLHHFLLTPVAWNICVSINLTSYTSSKLSGHGNIMQYSRIF